MTGDKDCRQLISDRVKLYNIRKDQVFDDAALVAEWGIRPEQVVDFQALVGDPVDNVPGVPLIGPKVAQELLAKYGTLDEVLDHAGEVAGAKRRENLLAGRQQAMLSRELVRLKRDVPVPIDWARARVATAAAAEDSRPCLAQLGFHRLADQVREMAAGGAPQAWQADYRIVDTPAEVRRLSARARRPEARLDRHRDDQHLADRGRDCRLFVRLDAGRGLLPARPRAGGRAAARSRSDAGRAAADSGRPGDREDRPEPEVRHDRAAAARASSWPAWPSTRWWPATCWTPASGTTTSTSWPRGISTTPTIKISELIGTGKNQKRMDEVPVAAVGRLRRRRRRRAAAAAADPGREAATRRTWTDLLDERGNAADRRAGRAGIQRHQGRRAIGWPS